MFGRRKIATLVAEFLGTGVLTLLILSMQRFTASGLVFFTALALGLTLVLLTLSFGRVSGAVFNPAITIGLWTVRKINSLTAILYIAVQMLGAWGAFHLFEYYVGTSLQKSGGEFSGKILTAEAIGAGIFALAYAATLAKARFNSSTVAATTGLGYMVGIMVASPAAIGILNPALAFGSNAFVWGTYVLGPILGAVIGINLYNLLFADVEEEEAVTETATAAASTGAVATTAATRAKTSRASAAKKPAAKRKTTTTTRKKTARK